MTTYLIGVDGGSQSTKVTIYDADGRAVSHGQQALRPMHTPAPGVVEHPDDDLWDSLVVAVRQALAGFPGRPEQLAGLGLCTIRFCRALLRDDGRLAAPVLSWMDDRVARPHRATAGVRYVTTSSGYLTHRLTGQLRDTAANYQGQWPIDTDTWAWAGPDAFAGSDLRPDMLAELVLPGEVLGGLSAEAAAATGLPPGLPVVATANDKAVEALGCAVVDDASLLISLGTYIAAMVPGRENPRGSRAFWTNFAALPHEYLYESHGIRRGMWTVSWLRDLVGGSAGGAVEEELNRAAEQVPAGSGGLFTVLDWLAPVDQPHRRGVMIGFDGRHGRAHLYRSVLEGIALTMHDRIDELLTELGRSVRAQTRVVVSGGGASSDVMMRILAAVLGAPTRRGPVTGAAGLGAAICAAAGAGIHPDLRSAVRAMTRPGPVFDSDPADAEVYRKLLPVYRMIPRHTDPVLRAAHEILG